MTNLIRNALKQENEESMKTVETADYKHTFYGAIPRSVGEFWTAKQRQMHSLHYVISYRASYKPELPDFFLEKYSKPADTILDPFGGRGTTALQACLKGRYAVSTDVNPSLANWSSQSLCR